MKPTERMRDLRFRLEELRLIYGKKLEIFLLQKLQILGGLIAKFFQKPKAKFFCCLAIVASSIYLGSIRDIGTNSAQLIVNLQENFSESGTLTSNLSFKNAVLAAVLFTNFLGIFSLWLCSSILAKSRFASDALIVNLLIICFAFAIFLSGNLIQANELLSASSLILSAVFPIFCAYETFEKPSFSIILSLSKFAQEHLRLCRIAFSQIWLPKNSSKNQVFEEASYSTFEKKTDLSDKIYQKLVIFCILIALLLVGLKPFFPQNFSNDFFGNFLSNFSGNFSSKIEEFFIENLLPILLLLVLNFRLIWANSLLRNCLWLFGLSSLVLIGLLEVSFEQKRLFFGFSLPLVALLILENFRLKLVDFRKNFLLILAVFIAAIANSTFIQTCIELLAFFWFLLPLLNRRKWRDFFLKASNKPLAKRREILIFSFIAYFAFLALFVATLFCSESAAILFGSLMVLVYLAVQQKLLAGAKYSSFSIFFLALTLANFTNIALQSFTRNSAEGNLASKLEAQNAAVAKIFQKFAKEEKKEPLQKPRFFEEFLGSQICEKASLHRRRCSRVNLDNRHKSEAIAIRSKKLKNFAKKIIEKDGFLEVPRLLILSNNLRDIQPIQSYLNDLPVLNHESKANSKIHQKAALALENQEIGVLIFFDNDLCRISLKESLLADPEFRQIFTKNFYFVNEVKLYETKPRPINFFAENSAKLTEDEKFALGDNGLISRQAYRFEVFLRKKQ